MPAKRSDSANKRMSSSTRFPVRCEHLCDGCGVRLGRGRKHFFNCTRYAVKGDFPLQEGLDSHLIGGIQRDAVGSALRRCLIGKAQTGKAFKIRLLKLEMP